MHVGLDPLAANGFTIFSWFLTGRIRGSTLGSLSPVLGILLYIVPDRPERPVIEDDAHRSCVAIEEFLVYRSIYCRILCPRT